MQCTVKNKCYPILRDFYSHKDVRGTRKMDYDLLSHDTPSLVKKKPRRQTQWNDPAVLMQSCEHLTVSHSFTSKTMHT